MGSSARTEAKGLHYINLEVALHVHAAASVVVNAPVGVHRASATLPSCRKGAILSQVGIPQRLGRRRSALVPADPIYLVREQAVCRESSRASGPGTRPLALTLPLRPTARAPRGDHICIFDGGPWSLSGRRALANAPSHYTES